MSFSVLWAPSPGIGSSECLAWCSGTSADEVSGVSILVPAPLPSIKAVPAIVQMLPFPALRNSSVGPDDS